MKLISSSTARRRTPNAPLRSFGGPQMPSPVRRIAPKPRRCTEISPPSETSPARLAESSFLFMIDLQNSPLNQIPQKRLHLQAFHRQRLQSRILIITIFFSHYLFRFRSASSQATVGWRRCRRTGDSFYKARTAPLPQPLLFLREAQQLGMNSSVENCGQLEEPAEESGASRSP